MSVPLPFFLSGALLYALIFTGSELLIIGIVVDSIFGIEATSFIYTLSLGGLIVFATVLKPFMSWYTEPTP